MQYQKSESVPPRFEEPKPLDCKPVPIPEPNGVPKLTPRDGCGPGIKTKKNKKKTKKREGGEKTNLPYSFKFKVYEIIFKMNSDYF